MTQRRRFRYRRTRAYSFFLAAVITGAPALSRAADIFESLGQEVNSLFEKAKPAIVQVEAGTDDNLLAGTGFFIDAQGTLLTSSSIIGGNTSVRVIVNGLPLDARILGNDPRTDLAMLRVSAPGTPFLSLGRSTDLKTGYSVLTVGYPLNLPIAPSQGLISGFDVRYLNRFFPTTHIHANLPISPGQVGGPLLNSRGEVVGLVVPSPDDGRSIYALPVEAIEKVMADFTACGRVRQGWVGVAFVEVPDTEHDGRTVRVLKTVPGTPASRSGIEAGDTVMRIDSREIYRPADALDAAFFSQVGGTMTVVVRREEKLYNYSFAVIERPETPEAAPISRTGYAAPTAHGILAAR